MRQHGHASAPEYIPTLYTQQWGTAHRGAKEERGKKKTTKQHLDRRKQKVRGSTEEQSHAAQLEHAPAQPKGFAYLLLSAKGHSAKMQWS